MKITPQQWTLLAAFATAITPWVLTILSHKYGITPDDAQPYLQIGSAVFSLIGGLWGLSSATPAAQVLNVKAMPEVATVVVKDTATGPIAKLAASSAPEAKDIVSETQNEIDAKLGTKT